MTNCRSPSNLLPWLQHLHTLAGVPLNGGTGSHRFLQFANISLFLLCCSHICLAWVIDPMHCNGSVDQTFLIKNSCHGLLVTGGEQDKGRSGR